MTLPDPYETEGLRLQVETARAETVSAYRDRDTLLALVSSMYPAHLARVDDEWCLVYVEFPTGQTAWPVRADNRDLFEHLEAVTTAQLPEWDGISSEERAERVRQFTYATANGLMGDGPSPEPVTASQTPPETAPAPKRRGRPRKTAQTAPDTATEA